MSYEHLNGKEVIVAMRAAMIEIKSTMREVPIRAVIYGADGVGKSTLCAGAPGAVFVAVEDGLANIDAMQVAEPHSWTDILESVDALVSDDRCHTIVIDSLDWAEALCWRHVCDQGDEKSRKVKNIEAFGYGKGYVAAVAEWRILLASLTRAGNAGKHVLLTAHAHRKVVKNPAGEDFEQWQIKLHEKAAGLIREWAHVVAFAELDIATVTDKDDGNRTKGVWSGKRVLRTQPSAGYQGKTRLTMPAKIPLDWRAFASAVSAGKPPGIEALSATLSAKLLELGDDAVSVGCTQFLEARGKSLASVTEAIATVDRYLSQKKEKST
jgi:hypothetical protein